MIFTICPHCHFGMEIREKTPAIIKEYFQKHIEGHKSQLAYRMTRTTL